MNKHGKMNATRITIVASAILAPLLVGVSILLIVARRKHSGTSLEAPGGDTLKQYKHRHIQRATKNFTQKLGAGGFSTVYKGELPDSTFVAVKELQGLHERCRECIIHCDIKPENILLDAEFNPKVADFGLAKLLGQSFSQVLTTMRGTRGYLAPEWFSGEPVTAKVDVYSYGQVLFEIISGRRNMNILNDDLNNYFPALVLIACWCTQDHDECRPTMTKVVQILEGLIDVGIPPISLFPVHCRSFHERKLLQGK